MSERVSEKRSKLQLTCRRESRKLIFDRHRQYALDSLALCRLISHFRASFASSESPDTVLESMLSNLRAQHLTTADPLCLSLSFVLRDYQDLLIRKASADLFVRVVHCLIEGCSGEAVRPLVTRKYLAWLLGFLRGQKASRRDELEQVFAVLFRLSLQASNQSKILFQENQIQQIIDQQTQCLSFFSIRILEIVLMMARPYQLNYSSNVKLASLARYLFRCRSTSCPDDIIKDHLLLSISCLVSLTIEDSPIVDYLLTKFRHNHKRILAMLYLQSQQGSSISYKSVKEALLVLREHTEECSNQEMLLLTLRNIIVNQAPEGLQVAQLYQEFFQGRLEAFLQPSLASVMVQLLIVFVSSDIQQISIAEVVECSINSFRLTSEEDLLGNRSKRLPSAKKELLFRLIFENLISLPKALELGQYLPINERQSLWQRLELLSDSIHGEIQEV